MKRTFDLTFENPLDYDSNSLKTIGEIIFDEIGGRTRDSNIILSHFENQYIEINLDSLRYIIIKLLGSFARKGISKGHTVILLTFQGCNEMITALFFLALAVKGCRIFLPMYSESEEFSEWIRITNSRHILVPLNEVLSLEGHEREKSEISDIKRLTASLNLKIWDTFSDFNICDLLAKPPITPEKGFKLPEYHTYKVDPSSDVLIVTTSGTSGKSKLVVYNHASYHLNCLAWEKAGFYDKKSLGGIGFTPLLTHTMGIRALVNALWTGNPVCLIITEWFLTKPETVRYLLLKMRPEHITGGPAVYNTFLEFFRRYPEVKSVLRSYLKTLVSSGAAYDLTTAGEVFNATGLHLHNAFGTTETQQVFSTLLSPDNIFSNDFIPLGNLLPGVKIGLTKTETANDQFRLYVKSIFGHKYCIGELPSEHDDYFDTGDIVKLDDNLSLYYIRRASLDYFKDCFGVKIPLMSVRTYYKPVLEKVLHAEFYPLVNYPGLGALLFIDEVSMKRGLISDGRELSRFSGMFEEVNNRLINTIEPFEFQHRHVSRIAVINNAPPRTGKGTISVKQIGTDFHDLITRLSDVRKDASGIEPTNILSHGSYKYTHYISPQIGKFLESLKLNYTYHHGKKDSLFTFDHGREIEVLDVTGGYGTNLLGYDNPEISKIISEFISEGRIAICNQLSIPNKTSLLAEKLNAIVGSSTGRSYRVMFGNSGSEAVEMALHHAFFEWGRRIEKIREHQVQTYAGNKILNIVDIWKRNQELLDRSSVVVIAITNSFHGNTLGARSLLGNAKKRNKFMPLLNIKTVFIDDRKADWHQQIDETIEGSGVTLERVVQTGHKTEIVPFRVSMVIAAFAEPVMGEGGVRVVNEDFLEELSNNEFPLISDEIQCGLGRTGDIPECKHAHYYLFGKALGGGVEKISAVLIDKSRFCFNFSEYYSSTFANGELAASVGLKVLDIIGTDSFIRSKRKAGDYLLEKLDRIKKEYPSVISAIEGKGLMLALYFNQACSNENIILRILFEKEKAGYLFSAWLLNRHHIRLFPTLSSPNSLRIEPSAMLTESETARICAAIDELCFLIKEKKMYELFSFLMDDDPFKEEKTTCIPENLFQQELDTPDTKAVRVAFIAHFAFPLRELRMLVPGFSKATDTGLRILFNRFQNMMGMDPVRMIALNLFKGRIHFTFYVIPVDSAELEFMHKSGTRKKAVAKIQDAVNLAASNGASVISLGGFTSILTNNGLSLSEMPGTRIITGNTLTAASGLTHLENNLRNKPEFNKRNIIAVVGATGNIGQVISEILTSKSDICSELLLVSRSEKRSSEFADELSKRKDLAMRITGSGDINAIKRADVIVVCSNTNDQIIFPCHIASEKPVLISDLSVPSAVSEDVSNLPNVTAIPFAAYVTLPDDENAVISSYSPRGTVFCCAAEAMLLGLQDFNGTLKGRILPQEVISIMGLARKHHLLERTGSLVSYKTTRM